MRLSIIIPAFNESGNIPRLKEILEPELKKLNVTYEVIAVNDGSSDDTLQRLYVSGLDNLRVVQHARNGGLGAAMRTGIAHSRSELLVFLDADLTFHPRYIKNLLDRYNEGDVEMVIGSHGLAGYGDDIPQWRIWISRLANIAYSLASGKRVYGISSLFRLVKTESAKSIRLTTNGFETTIEFFFKLFFAGARFVEIPTPLANREFGNSKLRYQKEIPRHLRLICRVLRWRIEYFFSSTPRCVSVVKNYFIEHTYALVIASIIAIIFSIPNVLIPYMQHQYGIEGYHPLSLNAPTLDEMAAYGSRLREVVDGNFREGDAYVHEYKQGLYIWGNMLLSRIIGFPLWLLNVTDISWVYSVSDALFPALAFLVLYHLAKVFLKTTVSACLISIITLFFPNIIVASLAYIHDVSVVNFFERSFDIAVTRFMIPMPGIIFFLIFLLCSARMLMKPSWIRVVVAGISCGLLPYIYFFYAGYAAVMSLILFLGTLLFYRTFLKSIMLYFTTSLIIAIPYIVHMLKSRSLPEYPQLVERVGIEYGRYVREGSFDVLIFVVVMCAILYFFFMKHEKEKVLFFGSLLIPAYIVINLQLFIGFNPQPDHWGSRVAVYTKLFALLVIVGLLIERFFWNHSRSMHRWGKRIMLLSCAVFLVSATTLTIMMSVREFSLYTIPTDIQDSFRWINENTENGDVIVTPSTRMNVYIPFFTHMDVYVPLGCYTLARQSEVEHRYADVYAIFDVSEKMFISGFRGSYNKFENMIRNYDFDLIYTMYCDTFRSRMKSDYSHPELYKVPQNEYERLKKLFNDARVLKSSIIALPYRADYLYVGPYERYLGHFDSSGLSNIHEVYKHGLVSIYKIN